MKYSLVTIVALAAIALILIYAYLRARSVQGFESYSGPNTANSGSSFIMYYADWCPHCQKIKPDFKQFMGDGNLTVNGKTVRVDMVQPEKEPEKVEGVDVKGYPTFLYSDANGRVVEYSGPRTSDGFMEFLKKQILS